MRPHASVRRATRSAVPASLPGVPHASGHLATACPSVVFPPTDPTRTEAA